MNARRRWILAIAAASVLVAAMDTYVIVLALPAIMADVGIGVDQLQAATPIVSGFLLGYVVVMPLLGRLSDLYGRRPLLILCLAVFAGGSLVTASATDLGSVVAGRALQGLGGGGLVPVTLALVADLWPAERRSVPLGVIGAVQELGSVLGPLYGGLILTVASWQTIFWLNIPIAAVLALGLFAASGGVIGTDATVQRRTAERAVSPDQPRQTLGASLPVQRRRSIESQLCSPGSHSWPGACRSPLPGSSGTTNTIGLAYTALGGLVWLTPIALVAAAAAVALIIWEARAHRSTRELVAVRRLPAVAAAVDWPGAVLLGIALSTIIVSFSAQDPSTGAISPAALWLLPLGVVAMACFVLRERRARQPLVAASELRSPGAYGALLTNLAVGAALMAALLDIPVLARSTVDPNSQLGAALVLLRLLVGVPIGAIAGGWLSQRLGNRLVAAARHGHHRRCLPSDDPLDGHDPRRSVWTGLAASERPGAGRLRAGIRPGDRPGQRLDACLGARADAWTGVGAGGRGAHDRDARGHLHPHRGEPAHLLHDRVVVPVAFGALPDVAAQLPRV